MRFLTPDSAWFLFFTALVPYALGGYLLVALLLVALLVLGGTVPPVRRWYVGGLLLATAGLALQVVLVAPSYLGAHAHGRPDLTVMTSNLRKGQADPAVLVATVRQSGAVVLVLEEVTPAERSRLTAAGLDTVLPYSAGGLQAGTSGTLVLSAYPLADAAPVAVRNGALKVRVLAPMPFWVVAIHPSQPLLQPVAWAQDWAAVDHVVVQLTGPVLVAGDFNATLDHRPVRELLDHGYVDAAERADSGWQPTYPDDPAGYGRFTSDLGRITIDHVLFNAGFDAIATRTVTVRGSDHRALIADLVTEPDRRSAPK